jgi:hypothetical protein
MSSVQLETFLARLYTDETWRNQFLANPEALARAAGLAESDVSALASIDRTGLQMAAASFAHKREARQRSKPLQAILRKFGLVRRTSAK